MSAERQRLIVALARLVTSPEDRVCKALAAAPKGKFDEDSKKKCFTDALKKGLSYLGFAADVFLGMHDKGKRGGR